MSLKLRHKNLQMHTKPSHIQKNSTVTNKITTKTKTQNLHKYTPNPHKETWNYHGSFSSCRWRTSWKGWITKTSQDDQDKLPQEPEAAGNVSIRHLYFTRGIKSGWYLQCTDGRCSNNQTSGEQGSATKHKGSVRAEELAAEDVAAAGPRVGRQFPELNPGFPSSLWTDISWCISFRSLWTTASPAQRHGLCTFIQANFSAAFTEEQQEAPWLETWLKRQKGTEVTAAIPSGYRAASFLKCTSRRVIRLQMTITNRRACYIG